MTHMHMHNTHTYTHMGESTHYRHTSPRTTDGTPSRTSLVTLRGITPVAAHAGSTVPIHSALHYNSRRAQIGIKIQSGPEGGVLCNIKILSRTMGCCATLFQGACRRRLVLFVGC